MKKIAFVLSVLFVLSATVQAQIPLTVSPSGATNVAPGTEASITVGFQANELAAGTYSGQLVIACNDLVTPSVTVPVTMTILPEELQVTPTGVFASLGAQGGPFAPFEMVYTLTNSGESALNWEISHTQRWATASPGSGTLPAHPELESKLLGGLQKKMNDAVRVVALDRLEAALAVAQ